MFYSVSVIMLCALAWTKKIKKSMLIAFSLVVLIAVAIIFEPVKGLDLYKHYQTLDMMREFGYAYTVNYYKYDMGNLTVYSAFFYIVSLLKYNKILLIITYLAIYGCLFGVLSMAVKDYKWSSRSWYFGFVIIMLTTNAYAITGIRFNLAFAICCLFLYIDLVRKKHFLICMCAYIAMVFLHDGMILIVLMRMVLLIRSNKIRIMVDFVILAWKMLLPLLFTVLTSTGVPFLISVEQKLELYTTQQATEMWVSGIGLTILSTVRLLFIVVLLIYYFVRKKNVNAQDYSSMLLMIALFCIGGISSRALIDRYTNSVMMYCIPFILISCNDCAYKKSTGLSVITGRETVFLLFAGGYFVLLALCQYRYFI